MQILSIEFESLSYPLIDIGGGPRDGLLDLCGLGKNSRRERVRPDATLATWSSPWHRCYAGFHQSMSMGVYSSSWYGLMAAAALGTPRKTRMQETGMATVTSTPAEMEKTVADDLANYRDLVRRLGLKLN